MAEVEKQHPMDEKSVGAIDGDKIQNHGLQEVGSMIPQIDPHKEKILLSAHPVVGELHPGHHVGVSFLLPRQVKHCMFCCPRCKFHSMITEIREMSKLLECRKMLAHPPNNFPQRSRYFMVSEPQPAAHSELNLP